MIFRKLPLSEWIYRIICWIEVDLKGINWIWIGSGSDLDRIWIGLRSNFQILDRIGSISTFELLDRIGIISKKIGSDPTLAQANRISIPHF